MKRDNCATIRPTSAPKPSIDDLILNNAECYSEHCVLKKSGHTEAVRPFGGCLSLFLAPASTHLLGSKSSSLVGLCTKKGSL